MQIIKKLFKIKRTLEKKGMSLFKKENKNKNKKNPKLSYSS